MTLLLAGRDTWNVSELRISLAIADGVWREG